MRLQNLRRYLEQKRWKYSYYEEEGLGSIDFEARGLSYHVWEFDDPEPGAESNVRSAGRQEDFLGDYEQQILDIIQSWN